MKVERHEEGFADAISLAGEGGALALPGMRPGKYRFTLDAGAAGSRSVDQSGTYNLGGWYVRFGELLRAIVLRWNCKF